MTWNAKPKTDCHFLMFSSVCRFVMSSIGTIPEAQAHARLLFGHDSLDCQGVQIGG
tara:strand:+ start:2094 stop:2261 length:168 start_codon:yes stop_codon:yes gene_type:complete